MVPHKLYRDFLPIIENHSITFFSTLIRVGLGAGQGMISRRPKALAGENVSSVLNFPVWFTVNTL